MKPKMKYCQDREMWFCGGLPDKSGYYIDWFSGYNMKQAYRNWQDNFGLMA